MKIKKSNSTHYEVVPAGSRKSNLHNFLGENIKEIQKIIIQVESKNRIMFKHNQIHQTKLKNRNFSKSSIWKEKFYKKLFSMPVNLE